MNFIENNNVPEYRKSPFNKAQGKKGHFLVSTKYLCVAL